MFENALVYRNVPTKKRIAYKTLVSAGLVALAVVFPQLVHLALGQPGGVRWLPMYLPVLIGGCLLGTKWGFLVGISSPLMSFFITSALGEPMPMAQRLPYMAAELAVFAVVSGLFTKRIADNGLWAFPAVVLAQIIGRASFLGLVVLTQSITQFTPAVIWSQIQTGFTGVAVHAVVVPIMIIALRKLLIRDSEND